MTRKIQDKINSDREIVDLRMQSEDLINNAEMMSEEDYRKAAKRISDAIDARVDVLFRESKDS